MDSDQNPKQINTENFNAKVGGGGIWLTRVNADALEKSACPTWPAVQDPADWWAVSLTKLFREK